MDGSTYSGSGWKRWWPFGRREREERAQFAARLSDYDRRLAEMEGDLEGGFGAASGRLAPANPRRPLRWWIKRGLLAFLAVFFLLVAWLAITAPLSKSLQPIAPPQITLLAADGTPIARNGAMVAEPVEVAQLPDHVIAPFLAIEDRRFYEHWGIDPRGIGRAVFSGVGGGSTITQQLAKFTFLTPERTLTRKAREALIALWLETWLTKDEILERYLSNAYFGDNQYGLRAAALHYFYRKPENLKPEQAAMLAGLLKAPSRLAPTRNYKQAEARYRLVVGSMVDAGYITEAKAKAMRPPALDVRTKHDLPTGTYFADWALPEARKLSEVGYNRATITTTLDARLQAAARRAVERAPRGSQVALVAMRPNGEVVAMIGGRDYSESAFNRVTQAKRQPGSTIKTLVYLAALRDGWRPDDTIDNTEITEGSYRPRNARGRYSERISLRDALAQSSNVATLRLFNEVGSEKVIATARDFGITAPFAQGDSSIALGSTSMTLLELTAAYAGIANNAFPVKPTAFPVKEKGWFGDMIDGPDSLSRRTHDDILTMLRGVINRGTGRAAMLNVPNFGKTGTSQDNRDALFVGFAGDLVVGVWVGNDDNSPLGNVSGGTVPARIWRDFMTAALGGRVAIPSPAPAPAKDPGTPIEPQDVPDLDDIPLGENGARMRIREGEVVIEGDEDVPLDLRIDQEGVRVTPRTPSPEPPPPG